MERLDRILVVDADGHANEGDVDLKGRLPEPWRSQAPISPGPSEGIDVFGHGNLPEPSAVKAARPGWTREEHREAAAAQGALR